MAHIYRESVEICRKLLILDLVLSKYNLKKILILHTLTLILSNLDESWSDNPFPHRCLAIHIRVGRFLKFTFVHIGEGYWSNIKHCETWKGFRNLKTTGTWAFLNVPTPLMSWKFRFHKTQACYISKWPHWNADYESETRL